MATTIGRPRSCDCGTCKKCKWRDYMRFWYAAKTPEQRRAMRDAKNKDLIRARDRERNASANRLEGRREYQRKWRQASAEKRRAHAKVHKAIAKGDLVRQPCEVCGESKVHAHHESYERPLDVRWLCPIHHAAVHHGAG